MLLAPQSRLTSEGLLLLMGIVCENIGDEFRSGPSGSGEEAGLQC